MEQLDFPPKSHQENLLALLCFDKKQAPIIRNVVSVELFDSEVYRKIARIAVKHLDKYKEPIGEVHLVDELEEFIYDDKVGRIYERIVKSLLSVRDDVRPEYVMSNLRSFVTRQNLQMATMEAAEELRRPDGELEKVVAVLNTAVKGKSLEVFNPGFVFARDFGKFEYLEDGDEFTPIGITSLDKVRVGPSFGELLTVLGATNRGKSWALIYIGKRCLLMGLKVLHITLEMSEKLCARRYVQALYSVSNREAEVTYANFITDDHGKYLSFDFNTVTRPSFKDKVETKRFLRKKESHAKRRRLIIKQFPPNRLTTMGLIGYMEHLEVAENFVPDVLIVDYADLMSVDVSILRLDIGRVYKDLRGIGVDRDVKVVTASQTNRSGEDVSYARLKHMGEDYSKAQTSDIVLAYDQTDDEMRLGLARLSVLKNRNEEKGMAVLISQAYRMGQFCLRSARFDPSYWTHVEDAEKRDKATARRRRRKTNDKPLRRRALN